LLLLVFILELALRFYYDGNRKAFSRGWVQFDSILVFVGVVDEWIIANIDLGADLTFLAILRVLRLLRLIRLVRLMDAFKELWLLVSSLINTARAMLFLMFLLLTLCYIGAIYLVQTLGDKYPRNVYAGNFDTIGNAMYSLLNVVTLDNWISIIRTVGLDPPQLVLNTTSATSVIAYSATTVEGASADNALLLTSSSTDLIRQPVHEASPSMIVFFFIFALLTAFGIMNLLVGRVVQTIHTVSEKQDHVAHAERMLNVAQSLAYVRSWLEEYNAERERNRGSIVVEQHDIPIEDPADARKEAIKKYNAREQTEDTAPPDRQSRKKSNHVEVNLGGQRQQNVRQSTSMGLAAKEAIIAGTKERSVTKEGSTAKNKRKDSGSGVEQNRKPIDEAHAQELEDEANMIREMGEDRAAEHLYNTHKAGEWSMAGAWSQFKKVKKTQDHDKGKEHHPKEKSYF
ncbi:unnamed protein product, partial [Amoebophrya sp. A25]